MCHKAIAKPKKGIPENFWLTTIKTSFCGSRDKLNQDKPTRHPFSIATNFSITAENTFFKAASPFTIAWISFAVPAAKRLGPTRLDSCRKCRVTRPHPISLVLAIPNRNFHLFSRQEFPPPSIPVPAHPSNSDQRTAACESQNLDDCDHPSPNAAHHCN